MRILALVVMLLPACLDQTDDLDTDPTQSGDDGKADGQASGLPIMVSVGALPCTIDGIGQLILNDNRFLAYYDPELHLTQYPFDRIETRCRQPAYSSERGTEYVRCETNAKIAVAGQTSWHNQLVHYYCGTTEAQQFDAFPRGDIDADTELVDISFGYFIDRPNRNDYYWGGWTIGAMKRDGRLVGTANLVTRNYATVQRLDDHTIVVVAPPSGDGNRSTFAILTGEHVVTQFSAPLAPIALRSDW